MKKLLSIFCGVLIASLSVTLVSCSDDGPSENNIVGTWECVEGFPLILGEGSAQYVQFNSDGNYYEVSIIPPLYPGGDTDIEKLTGTWKLSGNDITVTTNAPYVAKIKKSTKTTLTIEMMSMEITYKKVDDSVMNKYF